MASGTSAARLSLIGLPLSSVSRAASSSKCSSIRSASLFSSRPRPRASIVFQGPVSNALRAALTALSTSAASPSATWAITSPVAGLSVSNVLPLAASTHWPSISSLVWRTRTDVAAEIGAVAVVIVPPGWGGVPRMVTPTERINHGDTEGTERKEREWNHRRTRMNTDQKWDRGCSVSTLVRRAPDRDTGLRPVGVTLEVQLRRLADAPRTGRRPVCHDRALGPSGSVFIRVWRPNASGRASSWATVTEWTTFLRGRRI